MTAPTLLEAAGITKRFAGICALDQVAIDVAAGELVGLIGPNGAGKSTLFACLTGLLDPDDGWVRYDGADITRMPVHRRAHLGFARTFQRMELFAGMSVRDHLLVAGRAHGRTGSLVRDLLFQGRPSARERAAVDDVLGLLPALAPVVDQPIESLGLGLGRLVELGRALITEPKLLLLDEPSSGLDQGETAEMAAMLQRVQADRGTTIVLVEHDLVTVQAVCTRLFVLDHGVRIAAGPTADVIADPRVREAYLGAGA
jgi:branched-chain amino acid transport system ATP-binding protein